MLETSCRTACPSEADAPQARLTAPSALSLDPPDSSSHLGDSGSQAYAEDERLKRGARRRISEGLGSIMPHGPAHEG